MEEHTSPIKAQFPNPRKIQCKDCVFRDTTTLELDGETLYVGMTRDTCDRFEHKPYEVLFENAACIEYIKEL